MAGQLLTTASILQCPHGGAVTIASTNTRTTAGGAPLALATDTFSIAGCPFQIPVGTGAVPSPCVQVLWLVTNVQSTVNGAPTLSASSSGLCLAATQVPQGPVSIVQANPQVTGN